MQRQLEVFEDFNKLLITSPTIDLIIDQGLKVYLKMLQLEFAAIYLFDNSFEPILKVLSNINQMDECIIMLHFAIENGFIGDVMNSNDLILKNIESNLNIIIAPLIASKGALGFVLMKSNIDIKLIDFESTFLLKNFSGYLSSSIYGLKLENENRAIHNKIDQLVAVQTRSLLEKQKEISEKVELLKSSLLMTLPHEVRTPLNQILGLTSYLKQSLDETDKVEMEEILTDVHSSAVRLRRLFENYLYLSALTINSYDIEDLAKLQLSTIYSAESLIYETATNISHSFVNADKIQLELVDSPLQISEEHFNKIIYELVDNAFKFGDNETKVYINSILDANKYIIKIKDNGIGIPLERIYMLDAYIQFDRLSNEQQGSGLGLAIVKKILDIYQGQIKFKSEVGEFTEITITLPIADINLDDI